MNAVVLGKYVRVSLGAIVPAVLAILLAAPGWTGTAHAEFTCTSNADCIDTANGCGDGCTPAPCALGVCSPGSPGANAIGCIIVPDDSECSDGLFCNGAETCDIKRGCEPGPPPPCSDGILCTADSCDEAADQCKHVERNSVCSNGLYCDGRETCDDQLGCLPGTAPNCADNVDCTIDSCDEVNNTCTHTANNASCSNGLFCDGAETCHPTQGCQAASPPNCNDNIPCTTDSCNEAQDSCGHATNNAACSNGLFCDGSEICNVNLGCIAGTPPNCSDNISCTTDSCIEATDLCSHVPNNASCSNGLFCDGSEICSDTQGCLPGTPPNCSDGVACTQDACVESNDTCSHVPVNSICNNGKICDGVETCSANGCVPGTAPNCSDGIFCNGDEICNDTLGCRPGPARNCSDGVECTVDGCVESNDTCVHAPLNSRCDDAKYCDGAETCDPVFGCLEGTPPNCADNIDCTVDKCVELNDSCSHTESNTLCSNGQFCDGKEICDILIGCYAGLPPDCSDEVGCTNDTCIEETDSCAHTASNANCSNGLICDGAETCNPVLDCQDGTPLNCNDFIPCTLDSCSEAAQGCVNAPNDDICSNGVFCDGAESCDTIIGCVPGAPPVCADALTCTTDSCFEPADICLNVPNGALCGNGVIDPGCGEQCDPPSAEVCNNGEDDDGDGLVDCEDPNCFEVLVSTCDDNCQFVPPCRQLQRDPALISFGSSEDRSVDRPGRFYLHARLFPATSIDPATEGFVITLRNANGEIYSAEVKPIDLRTNGKRLVFKAENRDEVLAEGGILRLSIIRRVFDGEVAYGFRVQATGDFSRATLARMTTQVYFGDDVGYLTATWSGEPGRWTLRPKDYDSE